jgi:CRP-like cAMP-binding protein
MFDPISNQAVSRVRRNWLFSSETPDETEAILRFSSVRQLESNQTLFWQGESIGHVFLVLDGSLKLHRRDRKDRCRITEVAGTPDLVALHCLFSGNGYTTTAVAMQASEVLAINAERFLWHVKKKPEMAWRVAHYLSHEVENLVVRMQQLAMSPASERLAAYLLELHEDPERMNGDKIPQRRADLASLLSVSTETLCREISKFRNRGLISTENGTFTVLKPDQLRGMVEAAAAD